MDSFNLEQLSEHLEKISQITNPYQRRYEIIRIARDFKLSSEEVEVLWQEHEQQKKKKLSLKDSLGKLPAGLKVVIGILETIGKLGLFTGAIIFVFTAGSREKTEINERWQIINDVQIEQRKFPETQKFSSGLIGALEFLNRGCAEQKDGWWFWQKTEFRNLPFIKFFIADCIELKGINLPSVYLYSLSLPWSRLTDAHFQNADLTGVDFFQAKIQYTDLSGADLSEANFQNSDLEKANLKSAQLIKANLRDAYLVGADLTDANLSKANLRGANLVNSSGLDKATLYSAVYDDTNPDFTKYILSLYQDKKIVYLKSGKDLKQMTDLDGKDLEGQDLSNIKLQYVSLRKANLRNANLQNAKLEYSDLTGADLRGANLQGAKLHNTILKDIIYDENTKPNLFTFGLLFGKYQYYFISNSEKQASKIIANKGDEINLDKVNLEGAYLVVFDLENAKLRGANLRKANLTGVNLEGADLQYAYYDAETKFAEKYQGKNPRSKDLYYLDVGQQILNAQLENADLSKINLAFSILIAAKLNNSNLSYADLNHINLSQAELEAANLSNSNLSKAILDKAKLNQAILTNANLQEAHLIGAILEGAGLSNSNLERAELREASFKRANLSNARLKGANLEQASLEEANLEKADLEKSNLQKANLRNVDLTQAENFEKVASLEYAYYDENTKLPLMTSEELQEFNQEKKIYYLNQKENLEGAHLEKARMAGLNLEGAILRNAHLQDADLRGANLQGANLQSTNLQGADLRGADLKKAQLQNAQFHNSDIRGVDFRESVNLNQAVFEKTCYDDNTKFPPGFKIKIGKLIKIAKDSDSCNSEKSNPT